MDQDRTRIARRRLENTSQPFTAESASSLLEQSRGWEGAAREAHERIERGAEAVQRVQRRHNVSGQ